MEKQNSYHHYRRPQGGYLSLELDQNGAGYRVDKSFVSEEQLTLDGFTLIPTARFINVRTPSKPMQLPYDTENQRVLYGRMWHDAKTLADHMGIRYAPEVKELPKQKSPEFGNEPKPGASFRTTQYASRNRSRRK